MPRGLLRRQSRCWLACAAHLRFVVGGGCCTSAAPAAASTPPPELGAHCGGLAHPTPKPIFDDPTPSLLAPPPGSSAWQVQQGLAAGAAKEEVFLGPATARTRYGPELHAAACVLKLITA